MQTVYSNLISMKINPNELVLEFSYFFPQPNQPLPNPNQPPEVRVVLLAGALDNLFTALQKAKAARDNAIIQQKSAVGFKPQTGGA